MTDENTNLFADSANGADQPDRDILDDLSLTRADQDLPLNENKSGLTEIEQNGEDDGSITISKSKAALVKKLLSNIKENSEQLNQLLSGFISKEDEERISISQMSDKNFEAGETSKEEGVIIEGVFDGENMIGPDGKQYSMPANYASKSKLVEGDILKLTITGRGVFVYKQIGPIDRSRIVGRLEKGSDDNFYVASGNKKWRILTASVTYFKGEDGDEVVILVPKSGESKWGAVENIVKSH